MKLSESGDNRATKQCWECLKRRLVCDFTFPHCRKCHKTGKVCPGYDEQKPLQWVQNGKITSRRSKNDGTIKSHLPLPPSKSSASKVLSCISTSRSLEKEHTVLADPSLPPPLDAEDEYLKFWRMVFKTGRATPQDRAHPLTKDQRKNIMCELGNIQATIVQDIDRMFRAGGRARIENIVSKGLHDEAAKLLRTQRQPVKILEHLLSYMRAEDLPFYDFLSDETSQVVQAVQYYNCRIHPEVLASGELAPNPAVITFPLQALHVLPPTVHHTLVCMSVNHFIHSLPAGADQQMQRSNTLKIYHHRGAAIRSLSHYIGQDSTRCNDTTISSILMFMSVELQSPLQSDWRTHAVAMQRVVVLRGGFKSLLHQAPFLAPTLVIYILIITMANTCSPASDQVRTSSKSDDIIADYTDLYDLIFPYTLCPPEIFTNVLQINELRAKASALTTSHIDSKTNIVLEANDLLASVSGFVPEDWARPGAHYHEWLNIGSMYQAAVAVFCIMALQSVDLLPRSLELSTIRATYGDRLHSSLRQGTQSPRIAKFLAWPLVVAGVEAAYRGEGCRNWIDATLADLSRSLGTNSPLKASAVLYRYWKKGVPGWDECFDRPDMTPLACGIF
ncbi:hypothetical protein T440DRAFT_247554 [Plenodomus tracheiphilus IPT5]|uniref:Zn(2)-C6 fungal-type domain-containing protein n=1 Tax=Plenodomus tracheiphilus IPT5 TaxID=1408161 RepID=A0A6A7AS59_9PLEO|nr:hypothetical protein T440DRAFT_247554 [Plenodomus tracheiphilus IPT5]